MAELFAAIDESEDGYYAIVIGDAESISKNLSKLPTGFKHMTSYHSNSEARKRLVEDFDFDGKNILVSCVKFGLGELAKTIEEDIRRERIRMPKDKINRKIGYAIVRVIDKLYRDFVCEKGVEIRNLSFEVDNIQLRDYLKYGYKTTNKPKNARDAHMIADCIAYANYRNWTLKSVSEHHETFEQKFHQDVLAQFRR